MAIDGYQDIAEQEATFLGRAIFVDLYDQQSVLFAPTGALSLGKLYQLAADAQVPSLDEALLFQCLCDAPGDCCRDRQRCAVQQACCRNAQHCSLRVDQWATREARIGYSIGTNISFKRCSLCYTQGT